jgi:beta-lactamase regulating signal transducer with metallopeptidase domain
MNTSQIFSDILKWFGTSGHGTSGLGDDSTVESVGWLLLHSLWQFTAIAMVVVIALRVVRPYSARLRYGILSAAFLGLFFGPILTWTLGGGGGMAARDMPSRHSSQAEAPLVNGPLVNGPLVNGPLVNGPLVNGRGSVMGNATDNNTVRGSWADAAERWAGEQAPKPHVESPAEQAASTSVSMASGAVPAGSQSASTPHSLPNAEATIRPEGSAINATPAPYQTDRWSQRIRSTMSPWLSTIVVAWVAGMLLFSIRPIIGWYTLQSIRHTGTLAVSPAVQDLFQKLLKRMRIGAAVKIFESTIVHVPVVAGYFRPLILLPVSIVSELPIRQLEAIVAHELAHVHRVDYVVNLLQALVETVFFYHPAVWFLSKQLRIEREHCCDDIVVDVLNDRSQYTRALLAMTEIRAANSSLALSVGGAGLLSRVRRLWGVEPSRRSRLSVPVCLMVLAVGISIIATNWQASADEEQQAADKPPRVESDAQPVDLRLTILDSEGNAIQRPMDVHFPHVGWPNDAQPHRTLATTEAGHLELLAQHPGVLPCVLNVGDGHATSILDISIFDISILDINLTAEKLQLQQKLTKTSANDSPEFTIHSSTNSRHSIYVELKNPTAQPIVLRDSDLVLTSREWRVYLPKQMRVGGRKIEGFKKLAVSLDWTTLVTEGLWLSRDSESTDENWPAFAAKEGCEHYHLFVGNAGSTTVELPQPDVIARRLESQKKAQASIRLEREKYFVGEHIPVHYVVKNHGDHPIVISWGGDSRAVRPLRFKFVAAGPDGPVDDPFPTRWCMGGLGSSQTVVPGGEYDMGGLSLLSYRRFTKPGTYELRAYHDLGWEAGNRYLPDSPFAEEKNEIPTVALTAPVATAKIRLVMPSETQARDVIARSREANRDNYYGEGIFSGLQLNSYLPPLLEWIEENGGKLGDDAERRKAGVTSLPALAGIASIETPEATAALIALLRHKDEEVVHDAAQRLSMRLPNPYLKKHGAGPALDRYRKTQQFWRDEFRKPLLEYAIETLATDFSSALPATDENRTLGRKKQMLAASLLQVVGRQDDYPAIRKIAMKVVREYRDLSSEQSAYPRPPTVTDPIIHALWGTFCNGQLQYSAKPQSRKFEFRTDNLERLFAEDQIDVFTTARLLYEVETFRPAGWKDWVQRQLRSDIPWVRVHVMIYLPRPIDPAFRAAIATNLRNPHPPVSAQAIAVATHSPSAEYVPALQELVKSDNQWIKPPAETALATCLAVQPNEVRSAASANDEAAAHNKNAAASPLPIYVSARGPIRCGEECLKELNE